MDVDRMRVFGEVVDLPDLGGTDGRVLRDRIVSLRKRSGLVDRPGRRLLGPKGEYPQCYLI
jgi:hypothetical protein